tara:strand:+ start:1358 stop:4150 length:2793 start_codon:yes stop_codon:yes gene_type:complete
MKLSKISIAIALLIGLTFEAHADIAEVVGNNIIIQVTKVGEKYYETEFKIIREADPLRMELIRVEEIYNPKFSDASFYYIESKILAIPEINVGNAEYTAEFQLSSDDPIQFDLLQASISSTGKSEPDSDGDGIIDSRDAFKNRSDAQWLTGAQRLEITMILDRFSTNQIDAATGCGFREGWAYQGGDGNAQTRYPDGVLRDKQNLEQSWFMQAKRLKENRRYLEYANFEGKKILLDDYDRFIPETSFQYWADWLGYSPDIEAIKSAYWDYYLKPQIENKISELENNVIENDNPFGIPIYGVDNAKWALNNLKVESHGYNVITPDERFLVARGNSNLSRDVGYWTFAADGNNSVSNGSRFMFEGKVGQDGLQFDGRRLLVPMQSAYKPTEFGGSVTLDTPPLSREAFTLALSFRNGSLPKISGINPIFYRNLSEEERLNNERLLNPTQLLLSAGSFFRWLNVSLNQNCNIELALNFSPTFPNSNPDKWNLTYVVSNEKIDPTNWNDIFLTFNIPDKQVSMTLKTQENPQGVLETFTLPEEFDWSFVDSWKRIGNWTEVNEVDNNLNLFSGSGSGSFYGELDWIYAGNGVLAPGEVEDIAAQLESVEVVKRTPLDISVSDDGYVASMVLGSREYKAWLSGGFTSGSTRNEVIRDVYSKFKDDFDFVILLSNEERSELNYAGMYAQVSNDVEGITLTSNSTPLYDRTSNAGSDGRLQGVIHLPVKYGLSSGPSLHELLHRWGNFSLKLSTLKEVGGEANDPMMEATANGHWGISSIYGQLGGFDISTLNELGGGLYKAAPFGTFANGGNVLPYSNLELYLMGLIPSSEVEDIVSFKGISASNEEFHTLGQWRAEEKVVTTIEDIIADIGERIPDYTSSQKAFKALVLVLSDKEITDNDWAIYKHQAQAFGEKFSWATGNRASLELGYLQQSMK